MYKCTLYKTNTMCYNQPDALMAHSRFLDLTLRSSPTCDTYLQTASTQVSPFLLTGGQRC